MCVYPVLEFGIYGTLRGISPRSYGRPCRLLLLCSLSFSHAYCILLMLSCVIFLLMTQAGEDFYRVWRACCSLPPSRILCLRKLWRERVWGKRERKLSGYDRVLLATRLYHHHHHRQSRPSFYAIILIFILLPSLYYTHLSLEIL